MIWFIHFIGNQIAESTLHGKYRFGSDYLLVFSYYQKNCSKNYKLKEYSCILVSFSRYFFFRILTIRRERNNLRPFFHGNKFDLFWIYTSQWEVSHCFIDLVILFLQMDVHACKYVRALCLCTLHNPQCTTVNKCKPRAWHDYSFNVFKNIFSMYAQLASQCRNCITQI